MGCLLLLYVYQNPLASFLVLKCNMAQLHMSKLNMCKKMRPLYLLIRKRLDDMDRLYHSTSLKILLNAYPRLVTDWVSRNSYMGTRLLTRATFDDFALRWHSMYDERKKNQHALTFLYILTQLHDQQQHLVTSKTMYETSPMYEGTRSMQTQASVPPFPFLHLLFLLIITRLR